MTNYFFNNFIFILKYRIISNSLKLEESWGLDIRSNPQNKHLKYYEINFKYF